MDAKLLFIKKIGLRLLTSILKKGEVRKGGKELEDKVRSFSSLTKGRSISKGMI
jgi:hypothetical protein